MKILNTKYIFGLLFSSVLACTLSSCGDFLKEESRDEVIPKTTIDYKELLMGSGYSNKEEPSNFIYFMDDDVEFNFDDPSIIGSAYVKEPFPKFSWQPSFVNRNGNGIEIATTPGSTPYSKYYTWIMGCNAVLDHIDKAIGTQKDRDRVKAEALAVRAFHYFRLANLYGESYHVNPEGLAVPLKLQSGIDDKYMKRAKVKEVYIQIVNDLKEALRLMEPLEITRGDYHINQRAIHIFLSRVYLYMEEWDLCIKEVDALFQKGGKVALLAPWQTSVNSYLSYENPEVEWVYGGNTQPNQNPYIPLRVLVASFAQSDIRRTYFQTSTSGATYNLVSKLPTGGSVLAQVLRSSEALLNRAEAYVQLKNIGLAAKDLNRLRINRIKDYVDQGFTDYNVLLEAIREERRKEFCYEGFRWFDLRRYGKPAIEHKYQHEPGQAILTYKLEKGDPMYTLPFPNILTYSNPELIQNPSASMGERIGQ